MGDNLKRLMEQGVEQNALTPSTVSSDAVKSNIQNINESALQKTIQTLNAVPYSDTQALKINPEEYEDYNVTKEYLHIATQSQIVNLDIYKLDDVFFRAYNYNK